MRDTEMHNHYDLEMVAECLTDVLVRVGIDDSKAREIAGRFEDEAAEVLGRVATERDQWKACNDHNVASLTATKFELEAEVKRLRDMIYHVTSPGFPHDADEFSTSQLVEFLREAAERAAYAGPSAIGKWRVTEFKQAADRLAAMEESYLAVCPHEIDYEKARERIDAVKRLCDEAHAAAEHIVGLRVADVNLSSKAVREALK